MVQRSDDSACRGVRQCARLHGPRHPVQELLVGAELLQHLVGELLDGTRHRSKGDYREPPNVTRTLNTERAAERPRSGCGPVETLKQMFTLLFSFLFYMRKEKNNIDITTNGMIYKINAKCISFIIK